MNLSWWGWWWLHIYLLHSVWFYFSHFFWILKKSKYILQKYKQHGFTPYITGSKSCFLDLGSVWTWSFYYFCMFCNGVINCCSKLADSDSEVLCQLSLQFYVFSNYNI